MNPREIVKQEMPQSVYRCNKSRTEKRTGNYGQSADGCRITSHPHGPTTGPALYLLADLVPDSL